MAETLTEAIAAYIEGRKLAKLEPEQKKLDKALVKEDGTHLSAQAEFNEKKAQLDAQYAPSTWLSDAAKRAKQISLATHSAKFTHSDAKASSVLHLAFEPESVYLASHCLEHKTLDAAGNAAALDIARLLKIEADGHSLVNELQQGHVQSLQAFSENSDDHTIWCDGLLQALGDAKVASHTLAKQVYFPVGDDYHLLCPLYASSFVHTYHTVLTESRFSQQAKETRDAKRKNVYSKEIDTSYLNTLEQSFGGSKPQNISQLNSERYGKHYLLSCAPPQWTTLQRPPSHQATLFDRAFAKQNFSHLREFRQFLENLRPDQKNLMIRQRRDQQYLQPIIDAVFDKAAQIQSLDPAQFSGWSQEKGCQLKPHFCLWLDVWNNNARFILERDKNDWQEKVGHDFAQWLNHQLKSEHYVLGDVEYDYWKKVICEQLKKFEWVTPKAETKA